MYKVAIASYRRPGTVCMALRFLRDGGVPASCIRVYLVDDTDMTTYRDILQEYGVEAVVHGQVGMREARNAIYADVSQGDQLLMVDDDVQGLYAKAPDGRLSCVDDVHGFVEGAFEASRMSGMHLWGVYPVHNAFYMKERVVLNRLLILGGFCGLTPWWAPPSPLRLQAPVKTDYELSLHAWEQAGAVLRYDGISIKTRVYSRGKEQGGLAAAGTRTPQAEEEAIAYLKQRWPEAVVDKKVKASRGHKEIRLKRV